MPGGRPPVKTSRDCSVFAPTILQKLEDAFNQGMTNGEACYLADISETRFYEVMKSNPQLKEKFEQMRNNPLQLARSTVFRKLQSGRDVETSKWYLERKAKAEFSTRTESEETRNVTVNIINFHDHNSAVQLQSSDEAIPARGIEEPSEVQVYDYPSEGGEDSSSDKQAEHRSTPESE